MTGSEDFKIEGEVDACPACASAIEHLHFAVGGRKTPKGARVYFASGCKSCGLIFTNPPPSAEEVAAIYGEGGHWRERDEERAETRQAEKAAKSRRKPNAYARAVLAEAKRVGMKRPHVFDFGCGFGVIMNSLAAQGWRTTGLDPSTAHLVTEHKMISEIPTQPTFDVIVAKHVIEHLTNPLETLRALRRALKPGGFIMLAQPCLDHASRTGKVKYCINNMHHFTAYSRRSLKHLVRSAGLAASEPFHVGALESRFAAFCRPTPIPSFDRDPIADARAEFARCREPSDMPLREQARRAAPKIKSGSL